MKKALKWITLCLSIVLAFAIAGCVGQNDERSKAPAFIAAVEEIGDVSLESRMAIDNAYTLYDELTDGEKKQEDVATAKTTLDGKKAEYDALVAADDAEGFLKACEKVPAAADVTKDDQAVIEMAESLYASLSEAAKQAEGVAEAYEKLTAARAALDDLINDMTEISTAQEFAAIADDLTGSYRLTCDIDMSSIEWSTLGEFSGRLDGNGYTLKNFNYTYESGKTGFALFSSIAQTGVVERLGVTGYVEDVGAWAGVFCIDNYGIIRNCWSNVVLKSTGAETAFAGMIANANKGSGVIENCYMIGANLTHGTFMDIASGAMLTECDATAQVNNCFVLSDNNEMDYTIGQNTKDASHFRTLEEMKKASLYSEWDTDVWNIADGSLPTLKRDGEPAAMSPAVYIVNGQTAELDNGTFRVKVAVIDGDFADVVYSLKEPVEGVSIENGVVTVTAETEVTFTVVATLGTATAEATFTVIASEPVEPGTVIDISTAQQLQDISKDLTADYELTADIDLTGIDWKVPAGNFTGTFNGNGYTITFDTFTFEAQYIGFSLFKNVAAGAVVENVCLKGTIANAGSWFGTICVDNYGTIRNCLTDVDVGGANADSYGGGICCNCLADKEAIGTDLAVGGDASALTDMLKTTEEMKSAATYSAFDAGIWNITDGEYPTLKQPV